MSSSIKISIIVPIYNVENYIVECLNSIKNQTFKDIEAILVDDGGNDNSARIAKEYADSNPTVFKFYKKKNGGLSDARNFGLGYATGEYIVYLDSDDYLASNACERLYSIANLEKTDMIIYDYLQFNEKNKQEKKILPYSKVKIITKKEYLLTPPTAWNKMIKRSILLENQVKYPVGLWYEDRATTGAFINYVNSIYYINECLYNYRIRNNSIMQQSSFNTKMLDINKAMQMVLDSIDVNVYHNEIEYLFISNLIFQNGLRLLPYKKISELKKSIKLVTLKFPKWKTNVYFKQQSRTYKLFCRLLGYHMFLICMIMTRIRCGGKDE